MNGNDIIACMSQRAQQEVTALFSGLKARVFIRELSPRQRIDWLAGNQKDSDSSDARLVMLTLVDEAGNQILGPNHLAVLMSNDIGVSLIVKLANIALNLSGFFWKASENGQLTGPRNEVQPAEAKA
jgi:hypothetical protein